MREDKTSEIWLTEISKLKNHVYLSIAQQVDLNKTNISFYKKESTTYT